MSDAAAAQRLVVLVDDEVVLARLVELSSALARAAERTLELVYVESEFALRAAALPFAQVLEPAGDAWRPLAAAEIERGWRSQAARLRALAERLAVRHAVRWELRVVRGVLGRVALDPHAGCDLMLVAGAPALGARSGSAAAALRRITAIIDDSPAAQEAERVARGLARSLGAALAVQGLPGADLAALAKGAHDQLFVLPRPLFAARTLQRPASLLLIVG